MPTRLLALFSALALAGCARHTAHMPIPQTRIGSTDFGPGIVEVGATDVDFKIDRRAYVIALRARWDTGVTWRFSSGRYKPGAHYVRIGGGGWNYETGYGVLVSGGGIPCTQPADYNQGGCVSWPNEGYETSPVPVFIGEPPAHALIWLLIVSDAPIPERDLKRLLEPGVLPDTSLLDMVRQLPESLFVSRPVRWAAYYAPFGTPSVAVTR